MDMITYYGHIKQQIIGLLNDFWPDCVALMKLFFLICSVYLQRLIEDKIYYPNCYFVPVC